MAKFGLDYPSLVDKNPGLIYLSISAFGRNGPQANRPGFDDVIQATSGYMANNIRGDGPIRTGGPVLDYATGMQAASAVLAALLLKARTGEGQYIDLAMQDVAMLLLNRNTSIAASTGTPPPIIMVSGMKRAPACGDPALVRSEIDSVSARKLTAVQALRRAASGVCGPAKRSRRITCVPP